jgi:hypothetical protein
LDEVKIIESSDSKSFQIHPQIKTDNRTMSDPAGLYSALPERAPNSQRVQAGHCPTAPPPPPDFVQILNLGPTARFLRVPYINTSISNGSPLLATPFSC